MASSSSNSGCCIKGIWMGWFAVRMAVPNVGLSAKFTASCQFEFTKYTPSKSVPLKFAPVKFAPLKSTPPISALLKFAPVKLAPLKFAYLKTAPVKFVRSRLAPVKFVSCNLASTKELSLSWDCLKDTPAKFNPFPLRLSKLTDSKLFVASKSSINSCRPSESPKW